MKKSFSGIQKGMRVEHQLLGKGNVVEISPTHNVVVLVHFDNYQGNAQWMADGTLRHVEEEV